MGPCIDVVILTEDIPGNFPVPTVNFAAQGGFLIVWVGGQKCKLTCFFKKYLNTNFMWYSLVIDPAIKFGRRTLECESNL